MSEATFDIEYVARLARIDLSADERVAYGEQLKQIVGYVEKLSQLDIEGVEPTLSPNPNTNTFRDDVRTASLSHEAAMRNAPERVGELFRVPKIVE